MEIKKTVIILAASCMMYSCATKTDNNPFFTEFQTEYGVPAFDKIKLEHYEPAFLKGIEEQNQNIKTIIENPEAPTFENTIVALDNSSPILDRVSAIFFNMTDAETTDELTELSIKMAPVLSEHSDNISLNQELFAKVNNVYQQKNDLHLTTEQERLLDKTYKSFVRSGANLSAEKQARLREVNKELSTLGIIFSNNILNENNTFQLFVDKEEDLPGLIELVLQDLPEPVSCEIMESARILAIPRKQLLALMETDARLMRFLFSSQSHKVRRLYRQLKNTTNATRGEKKMAAKLWKLARDYGKKEESGVRISLKLTVTQLADMLGTKRETASRQLKVLVEQDLVRYDKNTFVIPEPDALNSYFKE